MKLSNNFDLAEFVKSDTATRLGIDNTPTFQEVENIARLVVNVLQPLRNAYGKPITVNSGYRCPALNKAVGGSTTSSHMKGEAADITAGSKEENKVLFELVKKLNLSFDQLIDEKDFSWVHVSYRKGNNRNQILHL